MDPTEDSACQLEFNVDLNSLLPRFQEEARKVLLFSRQSLSFLHNVSVLERDLEEDRLKQKVWPFNLVLNLTYFLPR